MRSSNKSRSRKNNNRRGGNVGNVVNRVFDSSGPEGKVRGTPQQIIDKYQQLARDASLSGDRVAQENFLQHSEHYARLLSAAMREMAEKKEQQEKRDAQQRQNQQKQQSQSNVEQKDDADKASAPQPNVVEVSQLDGGESEGSGLVETPETASEQPVDS